MFAAGIVDDDDTEKKKKWQFSSTFDRNNFLNFKFTEDEVKVEKPKTKVDKTKKISKKRKPEKIKTGHLDFNKVFLEDLPYLHYEDAFRIDKNKDENIYKYGSIYEGYVPKFRKNPHTQILGTKDLTYGNFEEINSDEVIEKFLETRFYSKKNVKAFKALPKRILCESMAKKVYDFIPLTNPNTIKEVEFEKEMSKRMSQAISDLNRKVTLDPRNLQNWFDLIDLHFYRGHLDNERSVHKSDSILLSVYNEMNALIEKALRSHPGSLKLRLLSIRLSEAALSLLSRNAKPVGTTTLSITDEQLDRDWSQLVFTFPQDVSVWRGYIAFLKDRPIASVSTAHNAILSTSKQASNGIQGQSLGTMYFQKINAAYKRAFTNFSNILTGRTVSHKPKLQTPLEVIDLFADYCLWLREAGHGERAFANWQAVIEFNCFLPGDLYDAALVSSNSFHHPSSGGLMNIMNHELIFKSFEEFWADKSTLKFPHPNSRGWRDWYEHRNKNLEPMTMSSELDQEEIKELLNLHPANWDRSQDSLNKIISSVEDFIMDLDLSKIDLTAEKMNYDDLIGMQTSVKPALASLDELTMSSTLNASISHKHSHVKGLCWLALERARDMGNHLPFNSVNTGESEEEVEDTERIVGFNSLVKPVEFCLMADRHFDDPKQVSKMCQYKLIFTFLQQYGLRVPENIAEFCNLPPDSRELDSLSSLKYVKRAGLVKFGEETSDGASSTADLIEIPSEESSASNTINRFWLQQQQSIISSSVAKCFRVNERDFIWRSLLNQTDLEITQRRLSAALQQGLIEPKRALQFCKKISKEIISQNPDYLPYYSMYATLLIACQKRCQGGQCADPFTKELNSLFKKVSQLAPVDWAFSEEEGRLSKDLTRWKEIHLKVILCKIQFDWLFKVENMSERINSNLEHDTTFWKACKHCLQRILIGDQSSNEEATCHVRSKNKGLLRLRALKEACNSSKSADRDFVIELAGVLAYSHIAYTLVTSDEGGLFKTLPETLNTLRGIEIYSSTGLVINAPVRCFLRLSLPLLVAFSRIRMRNSNELVQRFLSVFGQRQEPVLITVSDISFLMPKLMLQGQSVASNCNSFISRMTLRQNICQYREAFIRLIGNYDSIACALSSKCSEERDILRQHLNGVLNSLGQPIHQSIMHLEIFLRLQPVCYAILELCSELEKWRHFYSLSTDRQQDKSEVKINVYNSRAASNHMRSVFERFLDSPTTLSQLQDEVNSLVRDHLKGNLEEAMVELPIKSQLFTTTPSSLIVQLRVFVWRCYMGFEWMNTERSRSVSEIRAIKSERKRHKVIEEAVELARQRRSRVKAIFYRAIQDCPLSKSLYLDIISYFPYDATEVIEIMIERGLRVRTAMEEIDLLTTAKKF